MKDSTVVRHLLQIEKLWVQLPIFFNIENMLCDIIWPTSYNIEKNNHTFP